MKLFKRDTKDNIRFLDVYVKGSELFQESGIVGTENPILHKKSCKGKNIGKANETTPEMQAEKQAESLIAQKLKEGYFRTLEEAKSIETLFPMLAKDYKKEFKKIDWKKGVYVQPKLDGMRCLITVKDGNVTLMSREGRLITTMSHIEKELVKASNGVYDGELYAHGFNFQENMEFIKKWRDGDDGSVQVKFHCYDVVLDKPFKVRLIERRNLEKMKTVEMVETIAIDSETELKKHHAIFLDSGYEGSIVRHGDADYMPNGRSSNLLKFKDFLDMACEIIDIVPCEQRPTWGKPVFEINGKRFESGMKYSHKDREDFLKHKKKYIGKIADLRFFEYSKDGIPRFPVMYGIRLDKKTQD